MTFNYGDCHRARRRRLVVPYSVRIDRNGGLVETIEVSEFTVDPPLADTLFRRADEDPRTKALRRALHRRGLSG